MAWVLDVAVPAGHEALVSRETPKIHGSATAFIAVVVVLALIIFVSCLAVIYLLWESSRDRTLYNHHRRYHPSAGSEAAAYPSKFESVDSKKWHTRISSFFGLHRKNDISQIEAPNTRLGRGGGEGWMQAAGSDWDLRAAAEQNNHPQTQSAHATQMSEIVSPSPMASGSPNEVPSPPPASYPVSSYSSDTSTNMLHGVRDILYNDPYSPTPQRSIPNIHAQLPSPSSSSSPSPSPPPQPPVRAFSPEGLSDNGLASNYPNTQVRPFVTLSGTSMRTFEGGSKFFEAL